MPIKFKGVLPPMITPFSANGDVDYEAFRRNIEKWNESELFGYLVLGSNSETSYLSEDEKLKLVEITVSTAKPGRIILGGTGMESARDTIRLTNTAAKMGINAALLLTPFYYSSAMNAPALIKYFNTVADSVSVPVLLYNVPKYTHVNIPDLALKELCKHPNIIGMKDSTGDISQLVRFQAITEGEDFQILVGTAAAWYPAMTLGTKAGIFALANSNPNELIETQALFDKGEYVKSRELFRKMFVLNTAVTNTYGIAGLKYASTLLGYEGGFVRNPLMDLDDDKKKAIEIIFKDYI